VPPAYPLLSVFSLNSFDRRTNKNKGVLQTQRENKAENFYFYENQLSKAYCSGHLCLAICYRLRGRMADLACAYTLS